MEGRCQTRETSVWWVDNTKIDHCSLTRRRKTSMTTPDIYPTPLLKTTRDSDVA